ncbi:SagB/ThcOx family dehydrogenase [Balneolales bacterium ANBcel1]|nr:SagB/ThcOx family dehydrogenase [Balneolales bacterium ANBcel1]
MNVCLLIPLILMISCAVKDTHEPGNGDGILSLPAPDTRGEISVEQTLEQRRSVRDFPDTPLSKAEIGQLAWAAQGITDEARGYRTAPSAGATFPAEIYLAVAGSPDIPTGLYRYHSSNHTLELIDGEDVRPDLHAAALHQDAILNAPVVMIITGVMERIEPRYGDRAHRFMLQESGHIAQNVYLQGVARNIGTVVIGAFDDEGIRRVLGFGQGEYPLYIMPLGKME